MRLSPFVFPKMSSDRPQYGSDSDNLKPDRRDINGLRQFITATVVEKLSIISNRLQAIQNQIKDDVWVVTPQEQMAEIASRYTKALKQAVEIFNPNKIGEFYRIEFNNGGDQTLIEHSESRSYNPNSNVERYFHLNKNQFMEFVQLGRVYGDIKTIVEQAERDFLQVYVDYCESGQINCAEFLESVNDKIIYLKESLRIG